MEIILGKYKLGQTINNNVLCKKTLQLCFCRLLTNYFWTIIKEIILRKGIKLYVKLLLTVVALSVAYSLSAQRKMTTLQYINKYKATAIKKQRQYKIPASITLAQGILESGSGNSLLARKANNHFGIKCHKDWHGKIYYFDDDEKHECFRKYKNADESYRDHSKFLTQKGRYSFLFDYSTTNYKKWAYGLKKAGYATNPKYPQLLIKIIEKYNLDKFDRRIKGDRQKTSAGKRSEYSSLSVVGFKQVGTSSLGREILRNNGKKLIIIKKGDTFDALADEF